MKLRQALPYAVMLAVSAALYWAASRIEAGTGGRIGPGVWPKAIIVFMALLCAYEIVKRLAGRASEARGVVADLQQPAEAAAPAALAEAPPHRMLWWGLGLIAAYVLLVPWLGFFLATLLFLWGFPLVGGFWRPGLAGVVGLVGTLLLAFLFMRVAYISLPLGEGAFRALSIGLMKLFGVG